jgi:hypothetical protein
MAATKYRNLRTKRLLQFEYQLLNSALCEFCTGIFEQDMTIGKFSPVFR